MAPSDGGPQETANGSFYEDRGSMPRDGGARSTGQSYETPSQMQHETDTRSRPKKDRRPSDKQRICGKCQQSLTGQFVRALGDTYHLECFTCHVRAVLLIP